MSEKIISHYRLFEQLGAGGMGVVYRAEDTRLHRHVAIKFLAEQTSKDATARARFVREAQSASALNHPNICAIYDIGEHDGLPFIVMELLEGKTLRSTISGVSLPLETILQFGINIADALDAAHRAGIIHRDIKSSNIWVDARGNARLLDFGLAKLTHEHQISDQPQATAAYSPQGAFTKTGAVLGTMKYMSPEQARGDKLDGRSDLFSLGVVLYEMATGQPPFRGGKTIAVTFDQILNHHPPSICVANPGAPVELDRIISKALSKDPASRFQNAQELIQALRSLKDSSGSTEAAIDDVTRAADMPPQIEALSPQVAVASPQVEVAPSIAVLPFVNLSGNPENDYFGDGMAEELISSLMQVDGVRVVARTSAFQFKGQSVDMREVGRQLSATSVLEGSFRMAGNRIRISTNFINVADGYQIWSDRFDRTMDDIFAVQEEIARTIVDSLEVTLSGKSQSKIIKRDTQNTLAYQEYLKGRYQWKKRTPSAIHKAIDHFKETLVIDPEYAAAHAGLADCYALFGVYAIMPRRTVMPQAKSAAQSAIDLDNTIAEAWAALGLVSAIHEFDWETADSHFRQAFELSPDLATARFWYAIFGLLPRGRFDEALGQADWAIQLDPVDPAIASSRGLILYMRGDYEGAIVALAPALELDLKHPLANITLAWAYAATGRLAEAREAIARCQMIRVAATGTLAWIEILAGHPAAYEAHIQDLQDLSNQGNSQADFELGRSYLALNHLDEAFAAWDRSLTDRAGTLFWLKVNPAFQKVNEDPRYHSLLNRMNLADD